MHNDILVRGEASKSLATCQQIT